MAMVAATRGGGQGRLDLRAGSGCCGALGCDCGGGRKKRVHPTLSAREIDREREARIATLFDAHDISGSGTLKDGELKAFMEETSSTGTGRYETDYTVTDEDVAYVMAVAGAVNTPGEVDKKDVKLALRAWGSLLHDQTTIQSRFEDYANAKTGMMDPGQLSEMLTVRSAAGSSPCSCSSSCSGSGSCSCSGSGSCSAPLKLCTCRAGSQERESQ